MDSNQVTKDGMPPLSERNEGNMFAQENEVRPRSLIHEESQPVNDVRPQSPVLKHAVSPNV